MDVLACLAGAVVVVGAVAAVSAAFVLIVNTVANLIGREPDDVLAGLVILTIGAGGYAAAYMAGCKLAQTWGWCASCGLQ